MPRNVTVLNDADAVAQHAADLLLSWATSASEQKKAFHVALSGGSTPKRLYRILAQIPYREKMPYDDIRFYFGDERFVPHEHAESNYRMVRESLFDIIGDQNVYPIDTSVANADAAARRYHDTLENHVPNVNGIPQFDLVLLGMGNDGHTASLFPGSSALDVEDRYATATFVNALNSWRITLTYPIINHAKRIIVMVEGAAKADMIGNVLNSEKVNYPIQRILPEGEMIWLLDRAAASQLRK